ncbi:MAG: hypothetical protein OXB89_04605, partial [Anaerolineaceae bacterium]|nr:hypothetical protein [Anaerolineaceae bacterium]
ALPGAGVGTAVTTANIPLVVLPVSGACLAMSVVPVRANIGVLRVARIINNDASRSATKPTLLLDDEVEKNAEYYKNCALAC